MKKRIEKLFAVTAPGLEKVCAEELRELGFKELNLLKGGVEFEGDLRGIYLANLWLRTASRILVRVGAFKSRDFPDLYRRAVRLPWGKFVRPDIPVKVKASSQTSRLNHTGRIEETVSDAIDRSLGRGKELLKGEEQLILVRFEEDVCTFSVDSSGELLHRRGYRKETAHAPLRETLAAGILMLMGWRGEEALVDPMCGSGTFLVEGAMMAANIAPGSRRSFAFMDWPRYRQGLWDNLLIEAKKERREVRVPLWGSDLDPAAIASAEKNLALSGLAGEISLRVRDIGELDFPEGPGLILCNPPYGERVGADQDLTLLFKRLGETYLKARADWRGGVLCPDTPLVNCTGLPLEPEARLVNGGIPVTLFRVGE